ncbi:hypothetical protein BCR33DRAFT_483488 [Rhizoclosmatium globosum]|uniref:Uncharacterized protein n=1 Tax=Rhizoclosmatium globosum TaxID=329046 RepID=A0A1Y2BNP8_9FUNG|nr:hypothetical protein BCR33DRAFT_483488 [Rhizoclosmatium globosum]|eukprot:ORY36380.1 hypothetical protein BCR33DRAFT_483488 [Rhizoclosmatium globosum]
MVDIGKLPERKKGFDVTDMLLDVDPSCDGPDSNGAFNTAPATSPFVDPKSGFLRAKRRSSFPPLGFGSGGGGGNPGNTSTAGGHNRLDKSGNPATPSSYYTQSRAGGLPIHHHFLQHRFGDTDNDSDTDGKDYILLDLETKTDIDELMDSEPMREDVMNRLETAKQKEKMKEVLNDVDDYIAQPHVVKRQSLHPKRDVDQLISSGEHEQVSAVDATKSPKSLLSRAGSIFQNRSRKNSLFSTSQGNLLRPKISGAQTEDIDDMNAVYYPWTAEGLAAKDLSSLLELAEKLKNSKLHHSKDIERVINNDDIDNVVLVGSQENIHSNKTTSPKSPTSYLHFPHTNTPDAPFFKDTTNTSAAALLNNNSVNNNKSATTMSLHQSAPQIHKVVNFVLPERSLISFSDASIPSSLRQQSSSGCSGTPHPQHHHQHATKRDIDFYLNMANPETVQKVDLTEKKLDFSEIVDMAERVLRKSDAKMPPQQQQQRSKSFAAMSSTLQRLNSGRTSVAGRSGGVAGDVSIREFVEKGVKRAMSESSVCMDSLPRIKFEPGRNAEIVKEVRVKAVDVDAMLACSSNSDQ